MRCDGHFMLFSLSVPHLELVLSSLSEFLKVISVSPSF